MCGLAAACVANTESEFEGRYTTAFEVSIFEPCASILAAADNDDEQAKQYWLRNTLDSGLSDRLSEYLSQRGPTGQLSVYVRFVGTESPTKEHGYGHLGMYSQEVTVEEVLEMQPWSDDVCLGE